MTTPGLTRRRLDLHKRPRVTASTASGLASESSEPPTSVREGTRPRKNATACRAEFKEAALFLALWSVLVANEGVVRFIQFGRPFAPGLFTSSAPNRLLGPFLGGIFEVVCGLFGLMVGLSAGILEYYSRTMALALIGVQNILGWYVFIDYVLVIPAYSIAARTPPMIDGLSVGASTFIDVLGILTAVAFSLALQGGQIVFTSRLIAFSTSRDFLNQHSGAKMRSIFWNANYALAGLWVTIQAVVVINGVGAGTTATPFFAPPNVGRLPVYLLTTGITMILWPLLGIAITVMRRHGLVRMYAAASFWVFLSVYVHFTIGQLGFLASGPASAMLAAGASLHNGLVMTLCFLGPYFMLKDAQEAGA